MDAARSITRPPVLIVDDELRSLGAARRILEESFTVFPAASAEDAAEILRRETVHVVVCDQRMAGVSGVEFLKRVRAEWPGTVRILVACCKDAEDILAGIDEAGIWQYLLEPWHPEQLALALRAADEVHRLQRTRERPSAEARESPPALRRRVEVSSEHSERVEVLKEGALRRARATDAFAVDRIVRGPGSPVNAVCALAARFAARDLSVLVTGESGTGKELLARAIHRGSGRACGPFVVENCGALPDELLESELFGHKRGAFTGAHEDRIGLFQLADGGTIFLDEIGETSPAFQVKLLRALQEGELRPVGSARTLRVNVRVIAATNRDLEAEVRAGRFREDLYWRIAAASLHLPPLRERPMDIPLLAEALLARASDQLGVRVRGFTPEAMECLRTYRWPGNGRELLNEVQRTLALADGEWLGAELLSPRVLRGARGEDEERDLAFLDAQGGDLRERMDRLEARVLRETLIRHRWNKTRAAQELGLSRVGLRAKLARHKLEEAGS